MKKLFLVLALMLLIPSVCFAQAHDRRISDNDGHILDVGSGGEIFIIGGGSIVSGRQLTVQATATALASSQSTEKVTLQADESNLGPVYIGPATVTTTGYALMTGESVIVDVDNLSDIYVYSNYSNDIVTYLGIVK